MKAMAIGAIVVLVIWVGLYALRVWAYRNGRMAKGIHYEN